MGNELDRELLETGQIDSDPGVPEACEDIENLLGDSLRAETSPSFEGLQEQIESNMPEGSDVHDDSDYSLELAESLDFAGIPGEPEPETMTIEELLMTDEELAKQNETNSFPELADIQTEPSLDETVIPEAFPSYKELEEQIESNMPDGSDVHDNLDFSLELDEPLDFADVPSDRSQI